MIKRVSASGSSTAAALMACLGVHVMGGRALFRPCAITSMTRALRRAWTELSDGEPAYPRTMKV